MRGVSREFEFDPATNGIPSMMPMSFTDIEFANGRNPDMFVTGLLMFAEADRDEIYDALNFPNWRERIWTEESIVDALLRPNVEKMQRILAVRDILTIERIRGAMLRLVNGNAQAPINKVIELVNERWQEILRGQRNTRIEVSLPQSAIKEDSEKAALAAQNAELSEKMREMEKQIALLLEMQTQQTAKPVATDVKKAPVKASVTSSAQKKKA